MDPKSRRLPLSSERLIPQPGGPRAPAALSPPRSLEPGTAIGEFEVVREMARSGLGVMVEARQPLRERRVALRVLDRGTVAPAAVIRFREEAALADRMAHPGLVPVLSIGSDETHEFYAGTFMTGPTLFQFMEEAVGSRGEVFFREIALRFAELARAVEALHQAGILHRKIKPSSIFLAGERFILSDFEMAMDLGARPGFPGEEPRPEDAFPQPLPALARVYSAPEDFVRASHLDPRADIYSLGLTLYELATGISPFPHCRDDELALLKLTRRPIAPRRLNPDVPLGLEAVIRQAIETSPTLRHSSAEELASDLERFASRKRGPTRRHDTDEKSCPLDPQAGPEASGAGESPDPVPLA